MLSARPMPAPEARSRQPRPLGRRISTAWPLCAKVALTAGCRWKRTMKRRSAFVTRERLLAAQVAAVGRQPQPAAVDDAVERAIAVMAHVEPLRAVILGAV